MGDFCDPGKGWIGATASDGPCVEKDPACPVGKQLNCIDFSCSCQSPQVDCSGTCQNPVSNTSNASCNALNKYTTPCNTCGSCKSGYQNCSGVCVEKAPIDASCASQGKTVSSYCNGGSCSCAAGELEVNGSCVSLKKVYQDPADTFWYAEGAAEPISTPSTPGPTDGLWSQNDDDIYFMGDYGTDGAAVGIGTNTPDPGLTIKGDRHLRLVQGPDVIFESSTGDNWGKVYANNNYLAIVGTSPIVAIGVAGDMIGFGTVTPDARLHVQRGFTGDGEWYKAGLLLENTSTNSETAVAFKTGDTGDNLWFADITKLDNVLIQGAINSQRLSPNNPMGIIAVIYKNTTSSRDIAGTFICPKAASPSSAK